MVDFFIHSRNDVFVVLLVVYAFPEGA